MREDVRSVFEGLSLFLAAGFFLFVLVAPLPISAAAVAGTTYLGFRRAQQLSS